MPKFLARVLLHDGEKSYGALHTAMSGKGFETYFPNKTQQLVDLPHGTYLGSRQATLADALAAVVSAVSSIGFPPDPSSTGVGTPNTSAIAVVEFTELKSRGLKRRPLPAASPKQTK